MIFVQIVVSDANEPGEGEHKIMRLVMMSGGSGEGGHKIMRLVVMSGGEY